VARLEDLTRNTAIRGILPGSAVTVVNVQWFGSEAPHQIRDVDRMHAIAQATLEPVAIQQSHESPLKFDATPLFPERIATAVP
jgi:hypothetical protein